jgi:hypothetical protein
MGIDIRLSNNNLIGSCVSCGIVLKLEEVTFLDLKVVYHFSSIINELFPEEYHDYIRISWMSQKTVGVIIELSISELDEIFEYDIKSRIEETIGDQLNLNVTTFFES